jgi:hypothetical protein
MYVQSANVFKLHSSCSYVAAPVKPEVLTAVPVKITVFWDVTSCSLVDRYQHLTGM